MYEYKDKVALWKHAATGEDKHVALRSSGAGLLLTAPGVLHLYPWSEVERFLTDLARGNYFSRMREVRSHSFTTNEYRAFDEKVVFRFTSSYCSYSMPLADFLDMVQDHIGPAEPVQEKMRPSACKPVCATCDGAGSIKAMGWLHARCPDCVPPANLPGEVAERILRV